MYNIITMITIIKATSSFKIKTKRYDQITDEIMTLNYFRTVLQLIML